MLPALSQVCSLNSSFESDLSGYADAAGRGVELWLTKLEDYLKSHTTADVRAIADDRGLQFVAASFQGGLLVSQGDARRVAWEQFEQRLDLCSALQVPVLVIVPDFQGPFSQTDIERAQVSLQLVGQSAAERGVDIALEFQAKGTFLNNLETAASFVESIGQPNVGICLDMFHFSTGPSKFEDLAYLTPQNLFHVQFCDVADRPRELATDSDRILPGEGDFRLERVVEHLRAIDYQRAVSLELFNPVFWQIPAQQIGEIGLTSLRMILGQASMG